ncbi:MAG: DsrE family protein [Candidatus Nanopelagicales bacterium]
MSTRLVVHLTTDEPEKAATALTVAMTAAAGGATVDLWLSGPATMFAVSDRAPQFDLELAPDPQQALALVSSVSVCSQCAARRGLRDDDLHPGARIAGAASLVEVLLTDGTQVVTY